MRQPRVGRDHRVAQGLHHLGLDVVGQVPRRLRRGQLAPAVLDRLLLGERVVDAREELDLGAEHLGHRPRRSLPPRPVAVGQEAQRLLNRERLAVHVEAQPRHRLVEQPVPGRGAHRGLVVQEPLQLVGELVGLHRAHPLDDGAVAGELGGRLQQRLHRRVLDPVHLQGEEDQRRGVGGHLVLRVAHELGALGVGGELVVAQAGVGHDPPRHRVDALVALDALQHARRVEPREVALVVGREARAGVLQPVEVALEFGRVRGRVEVAQVPDGQVAEVARARGGLGVVDGRGVAHEGLLGSGRWHLGARRAEGNPPQKP